MRLISAAQSHTGLKRTQNEDNFIMLPSQGLYVLADGMGGHASGKVASAMAVTFITEFICAISKLPDFELPFKPDPKLSYEANLLVNAIKFANERVYIQSIKDSSMKGMGTTITAILNTTHSLIVAHVGDSRIYRLRDHKLSQITTDHSLLNHLISIGEIKPEEAHNFTNKNVIIRAIGLKDYVDADVQEIPRKLGDIYMMCSDGLSDLVSDEEIEHTLDTEASLTDACSKLINLALQAGGKDNVTVICVELEQAAEDSPLQTPTHLQPQSKESPKISKQKIPASFIKKPPTSPPIAQNLSEQFQRPKTQPTPSFKPSPISLVDIDDTALTNKRLHSVRQLPESKTQAEEQTIAPSPTTKHHKREMPKMAILNLKSDKDEHPQPPSPPQKQFDTTITPIQTTQNHADSLNSSSTNQVPPIPKETNSQTNLPQKRIRKVEPFVHSTSKSEESEILELEDIDHNSATLLFTTAPEPPPSNQSYVKHLQNNDYDKAINDFLFNNDISTPTEPENLAIPEELLKKTSYLKDQNTVSGESFIKEKNSPAFKEQPSIIFDDKMQDYDDDFEDEETKMFSYHYKKDI